jgi:DNA-binding NtrC family response regulator
VKLSRETAVAAWVELVADSVGRRARGIAIAMPFRGFIAVTTHAAVNDIEVRMTSNARILVVGDDALVRQALAERLRVDGYDILEAANGIVAIERACEGIDLVLLDYDPADIDATTVLRRIRERDPHSPVILLTSEAPPVTADKARRIGAYRFAKKPIDFDDLSLMVSQILETARLRGESRTLRDRQAEPYRFDRIVGSHRSCVRSDGNSARLRPVRRPCS